MQIIDRYLIRQFARVFIMTFISLLGVYIIGDFVTNFSEFMRYRDATGNFGQAMFSYYGARFPMFFDLAGFIVALLAVVLAVSWMQRHNEFTALQAAGISRLRIIKPLIIAAAFVAGLGILNREFAIPQVRHLLMNDIGELVTPGAESLTPHYDIATNILFDGDSITAAKARIENARVRLPFMWNQVGYNLRARSATYQPAKGELPAGYLLTNVDPPLAGATTILAEDGRPIILAPADQPWLASDQCFVVSNLRPDALCGNHRLQHYASTTQLISGLRDHSTFNSPGTEIALHNRFVRPWLDMTLIFLGLPFALSSHRRYVFSGAAKCILVIAVFAIVTLTCHALGTQALVKPVLAVWLPLLILAPAAVLFSAALTN